MVRVFLFGDATSLDSYELFYGTIELDGGSFDSVRTLRLEANDVVNQSSNQEVDFEFNLVGGGKYSDALVFIASVE